MNSFYQQAPLFRLTIAFIGGILAHSYGDAGYLPGIAGLLLILIQVLNRKVKGSLSFNMTRGVIITAFLFLAGLLIAQLHGERTRRSHFSSLDEATVFEVLVAEDPVAGERSIRSKVQVRGALIRDSLYRCTGRAIISFERDSSISLAYGDVLLIENHFTETKPPGNPHEFNYKAYLERQNIYQKAFVKSGQYSRKASGEGNFLTAISLKTRNVFLHQLEKTIPDAETLGVAKALILGYTRELTDEVRNAYSGTGAMHILAVSGMHVAILMLVFSFFSRPLLKLKHGKWINAVLILILLWTYSFITGLSPSVLRAAAMFSFVAVGNAFGRRINIYNSLAASAMLLLCIDPFLVYHAGFQLSYLAVIGIVYFTPLIYERWQPRHRFTDQAWQLMAVCVAAQLVTFPVSLLYFKQFPNYFFVANLIAVPLTGPIMYLGMALLVLADVPFLGAATGWLVHMLILLCNSVLELIEGLPFAITQGIIINTAQAVLLYFIVFAIPAYFLSRKSTPLYACLLSAILFTVISFQSDTSPHGGKVHVYQVPNASALDIMNKGSCYFISDTGLERGSFNFHILQNWWQQGFQAEKGFFWQDSDSLLIKRGSLSYLSLQGLHLVFIDSALNIKTAEKLKTDIVIVRHNAAVTYRELSDCFDFTKIVLDCSNDYRGIRKFMKQADSSRVYSVNHQGAFIYHF